MGLFSSSNRSTSTTELTTVTQTEQSNQQDFEGNAISGTEGSVTIIQTDQNAFDSAAALARQSLEVGEMLGRDAFDLSRVVSENSQSFGLRAIDAVVGANLDAQAFGRSAFSTVERSLGAVGDAYEGAAAYQKSALTAVVDGVGDFFRDALGFVGDLQQNAQSQLGSTVTALNTIAREQSKSTDERVAEVSGNAIKYVAIIVGVVALGATVYAINKR